MELIPLLIIVAGIASSIIGSKNNKEQEGKRNIDTSKLDRKQNTPPRRRQPETTKSNEQKGFFETLQEAFDEEFNKTEPKKETVQPAKVEREFSRENRPARQQTERPVRETINKAKERKNSSQNISDIEKRITDRSKHAKRASEARDSVYTAGYDERVGKVEGLGRDIADKVRYSYGDDAAAMHKRDEQSQTGKQITSGDLTFDSKSVVNGIIMSEILGPPKSKRKTVRKSI